MPQKPILVTGAHRSGTTWVGKMLAAAPNVGYIHEPFNVGRRPNISTGRFPYWYKYITADNAHKYQADLQQTLGFHYDIKRAASEVRTPREGLRLIHDAAHFAACRARGARPLMKDPLALFSAPWLAETFNMQVVVLIRHPAAFAASLKKADWHFPFHHLLAQPDLMEGSLAPFATEIHRASITPLPIIEQAILLWNLLHHHIADHTRRYPNWHFIRHEDISHTPEVMFEALYQRLNLTMSDKAHAKIACYSGGNNPKECRTVSAIKRDSLATTTLWQTRLSPQEVLRIKEGTAAYITPFYEAETWKMAA